MEDILQLIGAALLATIVILLLKQGNPSVAGLLSLVTCAMILIFGIRKTREVIDFIRTLERMTNLDSGLMKTLLQITGIAVITEISETICADSGNQALGKALKTAAAILILCLSLPMMTEFLQLIEGILKML